MIFKSISVSIILIAGNAAASKWSPVNALLQPGRDVEEILRREAEIMATLSKRQNANSADLAPLQSLTPSSVAPTDAGLQIWDQETRAACRTTLQNLDGQASNPSGLSVCYNVPFLDNSTGVFEAELRLYNVSAPVDSWIGVTTSDVSLTLSYLGATVENMTGNFSKRAFNYPAVRRRHSSHRVLSTKRNINANNMTELQTLMYVGRINSNLLGPALSIQSLQNLLIPQIDLEARNPISGQDVTTTLSSKEASFVNGLFSQVATGPTISDPNAAASASAAVISAAPFIIPGVRLAFFPIGLVVTSIWSGLFFLAVGLGTYGRIQFREQYRSHVKADKIKGISTI